MASTHLHTICPSHGVPSSWPLTGYMLRLKQVSFDGVLGVVVWQWIDKLGAWPAYQDASLSGPTMPSRWASFGQIWQSAQDRNDASWCVPLSMVLVVTGGLPHLSCWCMAMN